MSFVIISDGEPDDLIAIEILLGSFSSRGTTSDNIFVLATLRDAKQTAIILNKIIHRYYFDLHCIAGTGGKKPPLISVIPLIPNQNSTLTLESDSYKNLRKIVTSDSKDNIIALKNILNRYLIMFNTFPRLIDLIIEYCDNNFEANKINIEANIKVNGRNKMYEFIESRSQPVDIILLAPPIDLVSPVRNVRSIWSWGGYDRKIQNAIPSFNWRTAPEETKLFLNWIKQDSKDTKLFVCTPAIYQSSFGGFGGINEDKNKDVTDLIRYNHPFIFDCVQHWNDIVPEAVKKRCGIKPGVIQFTPADPIAAVAFLNPDIIKSCSAFEETDNIYFIDHIDYDKFIDFLRDGLK